MEQAAANCPYCGLAAAQSRRSHRGEETGAPLRGYLFIPTRGEVTDGLSGSRESFPCQPEPQFKTRLPSCIDPDMLKMTVSLAADATFMPNKFRADALFSRFRKFRDFPASFASLAGRGGEDELRSSKTQLVIRHLTHCSFFVRKQDANRVK